MISSKQTSVVAPPKAGKQTLIVVYKRLKTAMDCRGMTCSPIFSPRLPRNIRGWSNRYSVNPHAAYYLFFLKLLAANRLHVQALMCTVIYDLFLFSKTRMTDRSGRSSS